MSIANLNLYKTRCEQYKKENYNLRKRLNKLEKIIAERSRPMEIYNKEVEHITALLDGYLEGNSTAYTEFTDIPIPTSYKTLQSLFPKYKTNFVVFTRSLKRYIDFKDSNKYAGPAFILTCNQTNELVRERITAIRAKLQKLRQLLLSNNWTVNLSDVNKNIRKETIVWLNDGDCVLEDVTPYVHNKEVVGLSSTMNANDF